MEILKEDATHRNWIYKAGVVAQKSKCLKRRCGSLIVKNNEPIGRGYNSPPGDKEITECLKDLLPAKFKSDRTCCVHAEQRAIMDAMTNNSDKVEGSTIYFTSIDRDNRLIVSGEPYCTMCSKLALDSGIAKFVLRCEDGYRVYDTQEYNDISFRHGEWVDKT